MTTNPLSSLPSDKKLFMAHVIAGYPSLPASEKIAETLIRNGADILELQIPFSDPMADGPTIAAACTDALSKENITVEKVLALAKRLATHGKPVIIMSYLNPIYRYGINKFAANARKNGVAGVILPDTPIDTPEGQQTVHACKQHNLAFIPVVSPGTPTDRLAHLAPHASGFVYCTTRQGITGTQGAFASSIETFIPDLKKAFHLPVALGFGITTKADVQAAHNIADIAIAGSVFVKSASGRSPLKSVEATIKHLLK